MAGGGHGQVMEGVENRSAPERVLRELGHEGSPSLVFLGGMKHGHASFGSILVCILNEAGSVGGGNARVAEGGR